MNKPFQRVGSVSNARVGADFERVAREFFAQQQILLTPNFPVDIGLSKKKKHSFDLGASNPKIILECKSHRWTASGKVPSAKMTVWNEAMYFFHLAPPEYRKILFVLHDKRIGGDESLLSYYKRPYFHLIPDGVEFLEFDEATEDVLDECG
jgi:hypothetical protein